MGATNTAHYTSQQIEIALINKALGHPARIAILEYLMQVNSCICGDIVNEIPLAQATISQHLKELKNANLIKGNIEGNAICYCINENAIQEIIQYFSLFPKKAIVKSAAKRKCKPPIK